MIKYKTNQNNKSTSSINNFNNNNNFTNKQKAEKLKTTFKTLKLNNLDDENMTELHKTSKNIQVKKQIDIKDTSTFKRDLVKEFQNFSKENLNIFSHSIEINPFDDTKENPMEYKSHIRNNNILLVNNNNNNNNYGNDLSKSVNNNKYQQNSFNFKVGG